MRVKRGVTGHKRHHKIKVATKGMTRPRRASSRQGRQGLVRALQFSYRDRRNRKRTFRALWNTRINTAARENGMNYSQFIAACKASGIEVNRKMLAELAVNEPAAFAEIVKTVKK